MSDLSVEILKQIRDELKLTREELSARLEAVREDLSARLGTTNERLDTTNERLDRLERRQTETEIRIATELVAVVGAVHELRDAILEDRKIRETVANHETRITVLERHAG